MRSWVRFFARFWASPTIQAVDPITKLVAANLFTNEAAVDSYTGAYRYTPDAISADTGLEVDVVKASVDQLERVGFCALSRNRRHILILTWSEFQASEDMFKFARACFPRAIALADLAPDLFVRWCGLYWEAFQCDKHQALVQLLRKAEQSPPVPQALPALPARAPEPPVGPAGPPTPTPECPPPPRGPLSSPVVPSESHGVPPSSPVVPPPSPAGPSESPNAPLRWEKRDGRREMGDPDGRTEKIRDLPRAQDPTSVRPSVRSSPGVILPSTRPEPPAPRVVHAPPPSPAPELATPPKTRPPPGRSPPTELAVWRLGTVEDRLEWLKLRPRSDPEPEMARLRAACLAAVDRVWKTYRQACESGPDPWEVDAGAWDCIARAVLWLHEARSLSPDEAAVRLERVIRYAQANPGLGGGDRRAWRWPRVLFGEPVGTQRGGRQLGVEARSTEHWNATLHWEGAAAGVPPPTSEASAEELSWDEADAFARQAFDDEGYAQWQARERARRGLEP